MSIARWWENYSRVTCVPLGNQCQDTWWSEIGDRSWRTSVRTCVCRYVCLPVSVCVCVFFFLCVCVCVFVFVCVCVSAHALLCVCVRVLMPMHVVLCVCMWMCACGLTCTDDTQGGCEVALEKWQERPEACEVNGGNTTLNFLSRGEVGLGSCLSSCCCRRRCRCHRCLLPDQGAEHKVKEPCRHYGPWGDMRDLEGRSAPRWRCARKGELSFLPLVRSCHTLAERSHHERLCLWASEPLHETCPECPRIVRLPWAAAGSPSPKSPNCCWKCQRSAQGVLRVPGRSGLPGRCGRTRFLSCFRSNKNSGCCCT